MRTAIAILVLSVPFAFAVPAGAQDRSDPVAMSAISNGDYDAAEQRLNAELKIYKDRPELLLNLAAIYAKTGRVGAARAAYERVLAQSDVLMDLASDRTVGSHAIARTGLRRLAPTQFTAR